MIIRSMADPFVITDNHRHVLYEVRTVPDVAERLSLRSSSGGELAAIVRDGISGGFQVLIAGEQAALVRARGFIRRQYLIDGPAGRLAVEGNVDEGTYALAAGAGTDEQPRARVWRQPFRNGSRLRVIAADGDDTVQLFAIVLAVEYLSEDRRTSLDEVKAARGVLRLIGLHIPNL